MNWIILVVISIGLVSAKQFAEPEYLDKLREEGKDQEFADLMEVDVQLVRSSEGRSGGYMRNKAIPLGDILLSKEQEEQARQGLRFDKFTGNRWPKDQIPYAISKDYTPEERKIIENALADWNKQIDNVKMVKRGREKDYVMVYSGDGCYSNLGRTGGQQPLSLEKDGCVDRSTIQHEFMHAAGFTHEQNRQDRDKYIKMLWDNIPTEWQSQFQKVSSKDYKLLGPYDYYSIMHYEVDAPDTDGLPAFEVLQDGINEDKIGTGETFTQGDIKKLNKLYSKND